MFTRLTRIPDERMHLILMIILTFTTGINDAVGYLGLDKVFTGNMTGNVVVLGMAIAGGSDLPVLGPAMALVGFMVGAAVGGRVLRQQGRRWTTGTTVLFATVALIMFGLATTLFVVGEDPSKPTMVTVTTIAATAMGIQAAAARVVAVKDVTTVVVTSTITGLAADSVLGSGNGSGTGRRIAAVVAIICGAGIGAAMLHVHMGAALLLAAVLICGVTVAGATHDRQRNGRTAAAEQNQT
ncbi:YoaK family protein [Gordonia insulae]|uniref:DUF1275 domain-containing protein n=1 Tax=Gordonia insulae TaxID=2420509 RepID=A0A3G8JUW5_9ACTN|nr:YoaK family protein [Gordonia insulae]AZG48322.1 hypothetical protein D7316_04939 [Gordonia insulae]